MSSFGEDLRRERELRQISLREISEATKISLRYLDALERNDFRHLPGGVFNKGFVRAYSQYIGVDAESMVNAYLLEEKGQEAKRTEPAGRDRAAAPFAHDARSPARQGRRRGVLVLVLSALLLLIAAGIVVGLLAMRRWRASQPEDGRRDAPEENRIAAAARRESA